MRKERAEGQIVITWDFFVITKDYTGQITKGSVMLDLCCERLTLHLKHGVISMEFTEFSHCLSEST